MAFCSLGILAAQAATVTVSPASTALTVSTSKTFTALVTGTKTQGVKWKVLEVGGGSITTLGAYVAPSVVGTYHVRATSADAPTAYGDATITVVASPNATITALAKVSAGQVGLTASVANVAGSTYLWTVTGGAITSAANASTLTYSAGTGTSLTLKCSVTNAAGKVVLGSKTETVVAPPVISAFSANKTVIPKGTASLLTPIFTKGTGSITPGFSSVVSGSAYSVTPTTPTTYSLVVTNALGVTATQSVTVTPVSAPSISGFTATKTLVTTGTSTTLTPVFADGTGSIAGLGPVLSGSPINTGVLAANTTFTLTVTNALGQIATKTLSVNVTPAAVISSFSAAKPIVTTGTSTTLTAVFTGGTGSVNPYGPVGSGLGASTGALTAAQTYTLTVTNAAGDSATRQLTVNVAAAPVVSSFTAAKILVTTGTGTSLNAVFTGGTATVDQGIGAVASGADTPTGAVSALTTYHLTVTNAAGDSVTRQASVNVVPAASISSFSASKPTITTGKTTTLTAVYTGGTASVDQGFGNIVSGVPVSTPALTASTTYSLAVTNAAGDAVTRTALVSVVASPAILSFAPMQPVMTTGHTNWLHWTTSGAAQLTIDQGLGDVMGLETLAITPVAYTTYTLTATNAAGDFVKATTSVNTVPAPSITSFQGSRTIVSGTSTLLTPTFTNGTGTIDFGIGTVTTSLPISTGILTEPRTYTLTVTNLANDSVSQTATVDILPGVFAPTGSLVTGRYNHTSTLLPNGKVLIVGGVNPNVGYITTAELYDPETGTFTETGSPVDCRERHQAVLLNSGKVLIMGGFKYGRGDLRFAELYDPSSGTFSSTGSMKEARASASAVRLNDGRVLVTGGDTYTGYSSAGALSASAETYDEATGTFQYVGSMNAARRYQASALLSDGRILIAGGSSIDGTTSSVEIFDPIANTFGAFSYIAGMSTGTTATTLQNGDVLITPVDPLGGALLYDFPSGTFGQLPSAAWGELHSFPATLLANGKVLIAGGYSGYSSPVKGAYLYNPVTRSFEPTADLPGALYCHTSTRLANGKVLITGGTNGMVAFSTSSVYDPQDSLLPVVNGPERAGE